MPLYDYQCEQCGVEKETVQQMGAEAPVCCGQPMIKVFNSPAMVHIKGEGFPSRRKWMDNYDPEHPTSFSTGSYHGARY